MPTITDATVVAQAYDTSGNGGRKLVRLNDGSLCAVLKTSTQWFLYRSTNNGTTWSNVSSSGSSSSFQDIAIATDGVRAYIIFSYVNAYVQVITYDPVTNTLKNGKDIDSGQTALGNVSLAINEAKTELHATWASKNSTYPNSFNIRYAKGTINADGTVTWGAVEQITAFNVSGDYTQNPCIAVVNNAPHIITERKNSTSYEIRGYYKSGSIWFAYTVYTSTYAQSSTSAIFVPQSINGLANGRIWVAWHGRDATDTSKDNIRISYSDDGGITWSPQDKLTTGNSYNQVNATITVNRNNKVFVIWNGQDATSPTYTNIFKKEYIAGNSTTTTKMTNNTIGDSRNASSINSFDVNFTEPLFIYLDDQNKKVGFYGTWTVTTISVTPGDIGQKTDKNNILSYSITTDGEMSTITEKINGTVVNTRNTTSGQAVTLGLTQAQWDAIRFGKYADATGGKNTLTVEMGSEKWTYTFDKQLASDSDIISASKAVKDANEVYFPAQFARLKSVAESKGAVIPSNPKIDDVINGLSSMSTGRKASGTITSGSGTISIPDYNGASVSSQHVAFDMSVLPFTPRNIFIYRTDKIGMYPTHWYKDNFYVNSGVYANASYYQTAFRCPYVNGIVEIPVQSPNVSYSWIAFE